MHPRILPLILIFPFLTSCSTPINGGATQPSPLPPTTPTNSQAQSQLLIPANIPPGVATAIFEYFRLLNLALETGRTRELEELVAWDCPCLTPVPAIHAIYRDGLLIGAKYRIERMTLISVERSGATIQIESVRGAATQVTQSTGARTSLAEHRNITDFILENVADIWLIVSSRSPR